MGNRERGEVEFSVGDERYVLRFTTNAICGLEDELGISFITIAAKIGDTENVDYRTFRAMLQAGLAGGGRNISLDEAGDLLDVGDRLNILGLMGKAFILSFPKAEGEGSMENPPKAAAGAGGSSGGAGTKPDAATTSSGD